MFVKWWSFGGGRRGKWEKEELVTTHAQRTARRHGTEAGGTTPRVRVFLCCNPVLTVGLRPKAAVLAGGAAGASANQRPVTATSGCQKVHGTLTLRPHTSTLNLLASFEPLGLFPFLPSPPDAACHRLLWISTPSVRPAFGAPA